MTQGDSVKIVLGALAATASIVLTVAFALADRQGGHLVANGTNLAGDL